MRSYLHVAVLVFIGLVAGCADDIRPEPAELQSFEPQTKLKRIWRESIGEGQGEQLLQFAPFIDSNHIYAINYSGSLRNIGATTGLFHWQTDIGEPLVGGVGGDEEQVYVTTVDGELVAVDRKLGAIRWRSAIASEVLVPAVSYLGLVIVRTVNGKVAAYDARSGAKLWEFSAVEPALTLRGMGQPVVIKDAVITGMSNGTVAAISVKDGQLFWEQKVATPKGKTELERLVDVDGKVVVDNNSLFAVAYQGQLAKLGLFNGRVEWTLPISSRTTPAVSYRSVFVATTDGDIVAIDKVTQQEVWRQSGLAYRELTSPVSWGNYLIVGDLEGYIHLISQVDGSFVARIRPARELVAVAPVVYEDRFIVLSSDGQISAWGVPKS